MEIKDEKRGTELEKHDKQLDAGRVADNKH